MHKILFVPFWLINIVQTLITTHLWYLYWWAASQLDSFIFSGSYFVLLLLSLHVKKDNLFWICNLKITSLIIRNNILCPWYTSVCKGGQNASCTYKCRNCFVPCWNTNVLGHSMAVFHQPMAMFSSHSGQEVKNNTISWCAK